MRVIRIRKYIDDTIAIIGFKYKVYYAKIKIEKDDK